MFERLLTGLAELSYFAQEEACMLSQ